MQQAKPKRIQLSRRKGWKMPPGTVKVARPTMYGNPFKIGERINWRHVEWVHEAADALGIKIGEPLTAQQAVDMFRAYMDENKDTEFGKLARELLRNKNLACFCPLDQPCHADVLLELANGDIK